MLLVGCSFLASGQADSARVIIQRYIEESGGAANWAAVRNCYQKAHAYTDSSQQVRKGTESLFFSAAGQYLSILEHEQYRISHTIMGGGSTYWLSEEDSLLLDLPGLEDVIKENSYCHDALALADQLMQGMPLTWEGKRYYHDTAYYHIRVHTQRDVMDYYLDRETGLLRYKASLRFDWEVSLTDYREVAGPQGPLWFPFVKEYYKEGEAGTKSIALAVHVNIALPDNWFEANTREKHLSLLRLLDQRLGIESGKAKAGLPIPKVKQ